MRFFKTFLYIFKVSSFAGVQEIRPLSLNNSLLFLVSWQFNTFPLPFISKIFWPSNLFQIFLLFLNPS
jgi:hypothetical protein